MIKKGENMILTDARIKRRKAGIYDVFGNIFLLIIKSVIGFLTKSHAMIADSFNSAGDIFESLMAFISDSMYNDYNKRGDKFKRGKVTYKFSIFISIAMILVFCKLFLDSFFDLISGNQVQFSWSLVIVCIIAIITKILLYLYTYNSNKKKFSYVLKEGMKRHRNDGIITIVTLISAFLSLFGIYWFDALVGMGISIWVCYTIIVSFYNNAYITMHYTYLSVRK